MRYKLAILSSHPIQYQVPLYRKLAQHPNIDLMVYFCCDYGVTENPDPDFGIPLKWDIPLLEGYPYKFLRNYSLNPSPSRALGVVNPGIMAELYRRRYDALILHGYSLTANYLAFLAAWLTKTPVIFRGETLLRRHTSSWRKAVKSVFLPWLFRRTQAMLPIGSRSEQFYRHYGVSDDRLFLVPYAVDNDFFFNQARQWHARRDELKMDLGIASDIPLITYASKMIERKRPFDLLKAFEGVHNPAALLFVGTGELHQELDAYARRRNLSRVFFVGFKNQTELPRYYAMSDIFVLPSSDEPWGLVINEAMCFGLPIVTTDAVAAAGDLVRHGENGFIYSVGNIEALSQHLDELIVHTDRRAEMGRRSLGIISGWNYDRCLGGVLKALENITSKRREVVYARG